MLFLENTLTIPIGTYSMVESYYSTIMEELQ